MNYRDALKLAGEYDNDLLATDPRFRRSVLIVHEDGSIFRIDSAFLMQRDEWVFMFSEHHSFMVFDQDDLLYYAEVKMVHDPIETLKEKDNGAGKE